MLSYPAPDLPQKIPALDGLRGLSIGLVVFAHAVTTHGAPAFLDKPYFGSMGNIGVRLFFLISGFLITTLLLRELAATGTLSLKNFYIRRSLRIFPAMFAYIGIIWLAYKLNLIDLTLHLASLTRSDTAYVDLLHAVTFTYNYVPDYNWYFNHLWSLSVEEQFYLVWPVTIFLFGIKRAATIGLVLMCVVPLIRALMLYYLQMPVVTTSREFQAVADALLTGCIASIYFNRLMSSDSIRKFVFSYGAYVGGTLIVLSYLSALLSRNFAAIGGQTIANLGACLLLLHVLVADKTLIGKVLRLSPLVWLGGISYSLYLWQQPFLFYYHKSWETSFPINIALSFAAALISFHFIEKPFLKLKRLFHSA